MGTDREELLKQINKELDEAREAIFFCNSIDEGAESNPLNYPSNMYGRLHFFWGNDMYPLLIFP